MRLDWNYFVKRRSIKIKKFIKVHDIKNRSEFLKILDKMKVGYPDEEYLNNLFPKPKRKIMPRKKKQPVKKQKAIKSTSKNTDKNNTHSSNDKK